ncbi:unnamed protein product, partial [Allacma fusca]
MHGVSVHSALAIKRQRKRRDEAARRGRRRAANKGSVSEANLGGGSNTTHKVIGTVTTLHVGIIFCLIGFLFLVAAIIPSSTSTKNEWVNLVATGVTCLSIGTFLICLNRFYGDKEDEELSNYVEAQLGRTTSGHRLVRDQSELTESPVVIDIQDCSLEPVNEENRSKDTYRVYDKQRNLPNTAEMIGAMPSLALDRCSSKQQGSIGHLNRKNLSLHFRPPQLNSQSANSETGQMARHCANKRLLFQLSVLAPLCGALLLFVGLVQLIPGADGEAFSLPLILI